MPSHHASDRKRSIPKAIFLPDEFILGFIGRVRRLHGLQTERATLNYLIAAEKEALGNGVDDQWSYWDAIAAYAGLGLNDLVSKHTLINFSTPALRTYQTEPPQLSALKLSLKRLGLGSGIGPAPKFCPECRASQQRELGYSYWQRQHQMAGRLLCHLHGTSLWQVNSYESYGHSPCDTQSAAGQFAGGQKAEVQAEQIQFLTRYNQIADAIDRTRRPVAFKELQRCIRTLAVDAKVVVAQYVSEAKTRLPHFNQMISEKFPGVWLEEMKFAKSVNATGVFTGGLNTITPSGTALATYFAVLWESYNAILFRGDLPDLVEALDVQYGKQEDQNSMDPCKPNPLRCNISVALSQYRPF